MPILYALIAREKNVLAEYTSTSGNFPTVTRVLLAKIPQTNGKMSYVYDKHLFHYIIEDQITYLCMADEDFKRRIPFAFLEDIKTRFLATYGNRGQTAIAFAMNEDFQHVIRRQMEYYNANPAADSVTKVQSQLDGVKDVMVTNIEKVLERGEKIELLVDRTDKLNQQAFRFERKSRKLKNSVWWQTFRFRVFVGVLLVIVVYCFISMFCGFNLSNCRSSSRALRFS